MKKYFFILTCLFFALIVFTSCQNSGKNKDKESNVGSNKLVISYELNSKVAEITDKEQVSELESLFAEAGFVTTNQKIQQPFLGVVLKIGSYQIGKNDVIQLQDGSFKKADMVTFSKIFAIYEKNLKK